MLPTALHCWHDAEVLHDYGTQKTAFERKVLDRHAVPLDLDPQIHLNLSEHCLLPSKLLLSTFVVLMGLHTFPDAYSNSDLHPFHRLHLAAKKSL